MDKRADKKGFNYHVKIEHNMWNYIFYISYLMHKNKTDYLGFETYVAEKLESNDIGWFPLHKSKNFFKKNIFFIYFFLKSFSTLQKRKRK